MTSSTENNDELVRDLAKSLQVTSTLMQDLLSEMRQNSTSLAVLKEKLETLRDNVDGLSDIIRNGNGKGSLITRMALAEKSLQTLEQTLKEYHEELHQEIQSDKVNKKEEDEFRREKLLGKLKIAAVAIPGIVSLIILIIKMLSGEGAE